MRERGNQIRWLEIERPSGRSRNAVIFRLFDRALSSSSPTANLAGGRDLLSRPRVERHPLDVAPRSDNSHTNQMYTG